MYLLNFYQVYYWEAICHTSMSCAITPIKTYLAMSFEKGWVAFSKDNHLEEGDVGVFKVIERKPVVVLSVSIFHVVDHQSSY